VPESFRVGRRDLELREIIAKDVKASFAGGEGRDLTRRMLYLPALASLVTAVLMACAAALLALSEKAEATFPGKNGRIAYAGWNRGKDFEIYTINPNGSGKRQLTHNNTDDLDPAYSPDGKKIVYAGQDGPKGDLEIYTIGARGGGKFQVTHNDVDEEAPTYSPSGKRIAYTPIEGAGGIYTIKVGGGDKRLVARYGGVPSYSPDGKRIAYECYGKPPRIDTDICTISVRREHKLAKFIPEKPAGNTLHDVLHDKVHVTNNDTDDFNPDYSPDGNRIVYEGFEGSLIKEKNVEDASTNIYTIKVSGGGNVNLTKSPKNASIWNAWPRYSPDGEKIAYFYVPDGEIYTINARGGGKSRVTNDDAYPYGHSWGIRP
jgi:Tol biopolymer transport system component